MDVPRRPFRTLHLFSGAGGGILADRILGHVPVCAVECDPYCRRVLLARQRDGMLPRFPIWDDVRTFDGRPWGGAVDVVSGGFPCTDISAAGRGAGIEGEASGLWSEMARIIGEVRPRYVFVENSPVLTSRGLGRVLGDLAALGFDARWTVLGADDVGAPHIRKRIWIVASHASGVNEWIQPGRRDGSSGSDPSVAADDGARGSLSDARIVGLQSRIGNLRTWESDADRRSESKADLDDADGPGRQGQRSAQPEGWHDATFAARSGADVADSDGSPRRSQARIPGSGVGGISDGVGAIEPGRRGISRDIPDSDRARLEEQRECFTAETEHPTSERRGGGWWSSAQPGLGGTADGLAEEMDSRSGDGQANPWSEGWEDGTPRTIGAKDISDRPARLKAIGNGQVPQCAALAWHLLSGP